MPKIRGDSRGVSEVLGSVLILALVIMGLSFSVLIGSSLISDAQSFAKQNGVEQGMTVADSRLSKARFSTSIFQQAPLQMRDGTIRVNGSWDDSHIIVYDVNNSRELYNGTLGTIEYVIGTTTIAYQDGGVWTSDGNGGSLMISPPVFDYNGATLTLPIIQVEGNDSLSVAGNARAMISAQSIGEPRIVYPLEGFGGNPVPPGHSINITIKSDYYEAWASYINERTRAVAVTDPANKIVNVTLKTGIPMQSGMANMGFSTKSLDVDYDTPMVTYKMNLVLRNTGNDYTITYGIPTDGHTTPDPQLLIAVTRTKGADNKDYLYIGFEYTYGSTVEAFSTLIPFDRKADDSVDIDMLNHDVMLTYDGPEARTVSWGDDISVSDSSSNRFDFDDPSCSDIATGGEKTLYDVTQHYLWLMAYLDQQNGSPYNGPFYDVIGKDKYDGGPSTFEMQYQSAQDLKFLYITEGVLHINVYLGG